MSEAVAQPEAARGPVGSTRSVGPVASSGSSSPSGFTRSSGYTGLTRRSRSTRGKGVGGWLGFTIYFVFTWVGLAGVVTWFIIPSEIKTMMEAEGEESSVSGTTGLWWLGSWLIFGWFVWFIKVQGQLNRFWMSKGAPAP